MSLWNVWWGNNLMCTTIKLVLVWRPPGHEAGNSQYFLFNIKKKKQLYNLRLTLFLFHMHSCLHTDILEDVFMAAWEVRIGTGGKKQLSEFLREPENTDLVSKTGKHQFAGYGRYLEYWLRNFRISNTKGKVELQCWLLLNNNALSTLDGNMFKGLVRHCALLNKSSMQCMIAYIGIILYGIIRSNILWYMALISFHCKRTDIRDNIYECDINVTDYKSFGLALM